MLDHSTLSAEEVLQNKGWLPNDTRVIRTEIAGAGNMNLVERVLLDDGTSLILKRARGWVEKYPDIPAPIERAEVEANFYRSVQGTVAGDAMPKHLAFDKRDAANLLKDLGAGNDGMFVYGGVALPLTDLNAVADWTAALHAIPINDEMRSIFQNKAMRDLNALHIFDFPLDPDNGFDLDQITPGLQSIGDGLKRDRSFVATVKQVERRYLNDNPNPEDVLLHGDLYPGSWLTTEKGLFVIDPEFCWIGPAEWDVGVLLAHLRLSDQSPDLGAALVARYARPLDKALLDRITGIEIMRRIIGVAQLPLDIDLSRKKILLDEAHALVTGLSA